MTDQTAIEYSEAPRGFCVGLKTLETNRRQLKAAISALPKGREGDEIREVLVGIYGIARADVIINDMARGLVFK